MRGGRNKFGVLYKADRIQRTRNIIDQLQQQQMRRGSSCNTPIGAGYGQNLYLFLLSKFAAYFFHCPIDW